MQETILSVLSDKKKSEEGKEEEELELVVPPPCRTRSPTGLRRVTPTTATIEKVLPNGDLYMGIFSRNVPHGHGKYLWSNGCMYEREWKKGKASGRGKLSWPFGATFEGDFKSGKIDGFGTFIGIDGPTYKGSWLSDRKHGFGENVMLMGMCIKDSGKGTCRMVKEDKYDMSWENGVPKWEREGCAGLSCTVGLLSLVSVSAKGVKRERDGLCSSVR
ncbi:Phosphatidylinositol 4-phosphate 5-kinase 1 [Fagus crenata]